MLSPIQRLLVESWFTILDLVAPLVCAGCGEIATRESPLVCTNCLAPPASLPRPLAVPIATDPGFDGPEWSDFDPAEGADATIVVVSGFPYDGPVGALIQSLKYQRLEPIGRHLGRALAAIVTKHALAAEEELDGAEEDPLKASILAITDEVSRVVPVPLHLSRKRDRGFNQSLLVAGGYASAHRLPPPSEALRRTRATRTQTDLDREQRWRNVGGVFEPIHPLPGERVLLIDDVVTTGATIGSAAIALREAGAEVVGAVTLAQSELRGGGAR
ncbi:MAG: hypothetical protein CME06_04330 [Gemmatimonadetes bacterium]|nr:hypothetical protein [Gemmatimonadota bacterium]